MKHKRLQKISVLLLTLTLLMPHTPVQAQSGAKQWIYVVIPTSDTFELARVNLNDNTTEQVFSVAKLAPRNFSEVVPDDEVKAARDYLTTVGESAQYISVFMTAPLTVSVKSIRVAPNNQDVAVHVSYQACVHFPRLECFGTSQIVVVSPIRKTTTILWGLGFHSSRYLPKTCIVSPVREVYIGDIRWMQGGNAIIVSITGDPYCFDVNVNLPLVAIPLEDGAKAFRVGEAQAWTLIDDQHIAGIFTQDCGSLNGCTTSATFIEFDLGSQKAAKRDYILKGIFIDPGFGIGYLKGAIIFSAHDQYKDDVSGLGLFNPTRDTRIVLSLREINAKQIRTSPDGASALIESYDGSLWKVDVNGSDIHTQLFLKGPVASWRWGAGNTLLVRSKDETAYSVVDEQGRTVRKIDVLGRIGKTPATQNTSSDTPVEIVDW